MPNIRTHIALATQLAERLDLTPVNCNFGSFLLGSTTPDIRAMTKGDRVLTHFAPFDSVNLFESVTGLFENNVELRNSKAMSRTTVAFLIGYISHLVADQLWVALIYQPYFNNRTIFPDDIEAKVMDRALQLELDRRSYDQTATALPELINSDISVDIGFIDPTTLQSWKEWVCAACSTSFNWERLLFLSTRRQDTENQTFARDIAQDFLLSIETGLAGIFAKIPRTVIDTYNKRVIQESEKLVKEYLQCG